MNTKNSKMILEVIKKTMAENFNEMNIRFEEN